MKIIMTFALIIIGTLCFNGCSVFNRADRASAEQEVRAASQAWIEHFNKGDVAYCANAYSQKSVMNARPFGEYRGRDAIHNFWASFIASGANNLTYSGTVFKVIDNKTVVVSSNWSMNVGKGLISNEKWIKEHDGIWRLIEDDFSVTEQY